MVRTWTSYRDIKDYCDRRLIRTVDSNCNRPIVELSRGLYVEGHAVHS